MLCYYSHFKDEESGAEKGTNFLGILMHLFLYLAYIYLTLALCLALGMCQWPTQMRSLESLCFTEEERHSKRGNKTCRRDMCCQGYERVLRLGVAGAPLRVRAGR